MTYIVETLIGNTWENVWTDDDKPTVFSNYSNARMALWDLMDSMPDYDPDDYRIVGIV